jgi:hypothetical protein
MICLPDSVRSFSGGGADPSVPNWSRRSTAAHPCRPGRDTNPAWTSVPPFVGAMVHGSAVIAHISMCNH